MLWFIDLNYCTRAMVKAEVGHNRDIQKTAAPRCVGRGSVGWTMNHQPFIIHGHELNDTLLFSTCTVHDEYCKIMMVFYSIQFTMLMNGFGWG